MPSYLFFPVGFSHCSDISFCFGLFMNIQLIHVSSSSHHTLECPQTLTDWHCCLYQGIPHHSRNSHLSKKVWITLWQPKYYSVIPFLGSKIQLETSAFTIGTRVTFSPLASGRYFCVGFHIPSRMLQNLDIQYPKRPGLNAPAKMLFVSQRTCNRIV